MNFFLLILPQVILLHCVTLHPVVENENCDYDHCVTHNFVCAANGNEYQYFRNDCYLRAFNHCNSASECLIVGYLMTFLMFYNIFKDFRAVPKWENYRCIDKAE